MSATKETAVGFFVLLGLLCVAYLAVKMGKMELVGDDYYTLKVQFVSASGLRSGAEVQIAGVSVGRVGEISLDNEHARANVNLHINKNVSVFDDAIASIRTSGLIGDKYIDLSPGGGGEKLEDKGEIIDSQPDIDLIALISKYVFGGVK